MPILVGSTPPGPGTEPPPVLEPKFTDEPTLIWNGWTGDSWILAGDRNADTFIEEGGLAGILEPPVQHYFSESVRDGSSWQGHRSPSRTVTIPLFVWGNTPSEMRAEDAKFRATLRPERTATLVVAEPNGDKREITLRYLSGAEGSFSAETYGKHWIRHNLTVFAEDPYFYGDWQTYSFGASTPGNFYGGTPGGFGPPFYIGSSQTIGSAEVFNPGTEPAYVIWDIHGAMDSFQGGWPGAVINLPIPLTSSESLEVNSDPDWNTIIDQAGASRWPDVGSADITFAPLPAGVKTNLALSVTTSDANTLVQVRFRPKYRSAW